MTLSHRLFAALLGAGLLASPAIAYERPRGPIERAIRGDSPRDQDRAYRATIDGRSMPLPKIEQRVMPFMPGADYLGPEFRGESYRLKFMRSGRVIWVDVDAATGRIIGRSGN